LAMEEVRMEFVVVREVDSWYISNIFDEKFAQLQDLLQGQTQLSAAVPLQGTATPAGPGGGAGAQPGATTTSSDIGRQLADAQFNATLQGFNQASRGAAPAPGPASPPQ